MPGDLDVNPTTGALCVATDGKLQPCGCGGCCYDDAGPGTLTITFAGAAPCDCLFGCLLAAKLSGTFGGTFTLTRTAHSNFGTPSCKYEYDGPYTGVTFDLFQDASFFPGGDGSGDTDCSDAIICSTTRIRITLQSPPINTPPFTGWELWVELYKPMPSGCLCGPTDNDVTTLAGAFLFYSDGFVLDMCGGTVTIGNAGVCTTAGPDCCAVFGGGFLQPYQGNTVTTGGTATITL